MTLESRMYEQVWRLINCAYHHGTAEDKDAASDVQAWVDSQPQMPEEVTITLHYTEWHDIIMGLEQGDLLTRSYEDGTLNAPDCDWDAIRYLNNLGDEYADKLRGLLKAHQEAV